jgi:hypothetical protein
MRIVVFVQMLDDRLGVAPSHAISMRIEAAGPHAFPLISSFAHTYLSIFSSKYIRI